MEFGQGGLDFREADRLYADLKRQRDAGEIGDGEFDEQRKRLMVEDAEGRWWAKGREADEWFYRGENGWARGTPPIYEPAYDSEEQPPHRDDERAEERAGRRTALVAGLSTLSALVVIILTTSLLTSVGFGLGATPREEIPVPDLTGQTEDAAARDAGGDFEIEVGGTTAGDEPEDTVVSQSPEPGERAPKGSTISVFLSGGQPEAAEEEETAEEETTADDEETTEDEEESTADEEASSASDEAEAPEEPSAREKPAASGGGEKESAAPAKAEAKARPVPDAVGRNIGEAERLLADAGLEYVVETVESDRPAGTVVSTDPPAGTMLDPAAGKVTVRQSKGPAADAPKEKTNPKADPKVDPKANLKVDPKADPKAEPKTEPKEKLEVKEAVGPEGKTGVEFDAAKAGAKGQ